MKQSAKGERKGFFEWLDNIDPTPWHQAFLFGIALAMLFLMAFIGSDRP